MLNNVLKAIVGGTPPAPGPAPTPLPAATQPPVPAPTPVSASATIPDFSTTNGSSPGVSPPGGPDAPVWQSVPLSFRPDPSIQVDEDTARAQVLDLQRQHWVASIVERLDNPVARPALLPEASEAGPEPTKPEAA